MKVYVGSVFLMQELIFLKLAKDTLYDYKLWKCDVIGEKEGSLSWSLRWLPKLYCSRHVVGTYISGLMIHTYRNYFPSVSLLSLPTSRKGNSAQKNRENRRGLKSTIFFEKILGSWPPSCGSKVWTGTNCKIVETLFDPASHLANTKARIHKLENPFAGACYRTAAYDRLLDPNMILFLWMLNMHGILRNIWAT